ncbi:sodium/calcium exchanger 2a isoform X1 [Gadus morhua]|uniref:Solute carrier family 8 member 2a n=1 Tax=Gadus morhua TaxID=8049 RepID=A0A8C5BSF3_GADMO|nr:sodium/calcium exchanger 2-like isoform X1 [Gadus morhua]XP_030216214.1 sodium/calcium exchanger 2-like isoform X1 [Gadus morhua]XP_030216215.1 sodium/calcium exchanger 2-like isoform X1 [Gadus morhua]
MGPLPLHPYPVLLFLLLTSGLLLLPQPSASSQSQAVERASGTQQPHTPSTNTTPPKKCADKVVCHPGILLPVWLPLDPPIGEQAGRAILYFSCLLYMFLGVSIIADRFMASIEVITSQEKEVTITKPNGEVQVTTVRIWNETVSNLTLMALGSSAPEILLSVIEVCGHNFHAGELGPGTIVGSAAFNMFVILGVCVLVIPDGESRKIKHLRVFFITAFWSIFAYIWLYLILAVISPGIVEVWEAVVTLLYFPVCVVLAWIADRRLLFYKYMNKRYRADKRHGIVVQMEGDAEPNGIDVVMDGKFPDGGAGAGNCSSVSVSVQAAGEEDANREEVVRILKELKEKHPDKDLEQLIEMANYSALLQQKKSRAFRRIQATRLMIGAGSVLWKHVRHRQAMGGVAGGGDGASCAIVFFERAQYQCTENCGATNLAVVCQGGTGQDTFQVDYCTENGSANAGADYELAKGTLVFKPGETRKEIKVGILDDDVFEEDEHFFVRLQNLRLEDGSVSTPPKGRLVEPTLATVTIIDDDHAGIFTFSQRLLRVSESSGVVAVKVVRNSGSRGTVCVPYRTEDGTARSGVDYESAQGELEFTNEQTSQIIQVRIINVAEYEKQETFSVILEDPKWLKRGISALLLNQGNPSPEEEDARRIAEMGKPILGEHRRLEVVIEENCNFKSTVDKLLKDTNLATVIGTNSWKEQFIEAVTVSGGEGEDGEEQRMPNCFDYFLHIMTIFWKILFAFVPPTAYWNGWACFVISIMVIGFLTAIIGDLASHFGCTVGLRDTVTAVVFVALGTSIPDTFASKVAATQDPYADASIGNVTGSNAVNVFLGIGLAWSVAAIYWEVKGLKFHVDPGSLAFSVTLFTIFAFLIIAVLMIRRRPSIGGELGGSKCGKTLTALFFFGLWFLYILFSSLEAYCHITAF